jgi:hypothetical protein
MVKKIKGLRVGTRFSRKFKFDNEGQSQFGDSATNEHSILGKAEAEDTNVEGPLTVDQRIANALFGLPQMHGVNDAADLQELVDQAQDYEGFMIYLTTASTISPFLDDEKFYFCEDATWHPSPFMSVAVETDTDGDGVVDALDAYPNDPFLTFTPTRQHRIYFYYMPTTSPYTMKTLSSANGHLQFSKYTKLRSDIDWSAATPNDGGHGYPPGDGTYNYTSGFTGYALHNHDWWKYTDFDTKPDDNVYTMDIDLTQNMPAGYGIGLLVGNVDVSSDPESIWHLDNGVKTAENPNGYVQITPYPETIDELDAQGNPTGLKVLPREGRLKIQLKHATDDNIYIRIAHGATEGDIDIDSMPWIESSLIDSDYDYRPTPYDQFPADGTEWEDADSDGLGSFTENVPTTYHVGSDLWHKVNGSWESTFVFGQGGTKTYTLKTSDSNPDFDADGTLDGADLFPRDSRRTQDSQGLHLGILRQPMSLASTQNGDVTYLSQGKIWFSEYNSQTDTFVNSKTVQAHHPNHWDTGDTMWSNLGAGYLDTNPHYIPASSHMWDIARNSLSQSLGFGDYMTFDLSQSATYKFHMYTPGTNWPASTLDKTTYLVAYSGSLVSAQDNNYLFTNNPVSASAMNNFYHWFWNENTGVDHNGTEFINFDTAVNGAFAAEQNLHLLTDYTGKDDMENPGAHPFYGSTNPRHHFWLHIPGDGTFETAPVMFRTERNYDTDYDYNTHLNQYDNLNDFMFEQDAAGDLTLKENPNPAIGQQSFELDAQGDLQLT